MTSAATSALTPTSCTVTLSGVSDVLHASTWDPVFKPLTQGWAQANRTWTLTLDQDLFDLYGYYIYRGVIAAPVLVSAMDDPLWYPGGFPNLRLACRWTGPTELLMSLSGDPGPPTTGIIPPVLSTNLAVATSAAFTGGPFGYYDGYDNITTGVITIVSWQ